MSRAILNILIRNTTANTYPSSSNIWNGNTTEPGPLKNVRVVDVCEVISGPYTSGLLADLGADVIKIEPPKGEESRTNASNLSECSKATCCATTPPKDSPIIEARSMASSLSAAATSLARKEKV